MRQAEFYFGILAFAAVIAYKSVKVGVSAAVGAARAKWVPNEAA